MTVYELQQHCFAHSSQPDGIHDPFIIGSTIEADVSYFIVAWSTSALIELQHSSKLFCVDGTYKLTTGGYPCLVNKIKRILFIIFN